MYVVDPMYHYVIIPFDPQHLPKHALLILQGAGCKRTECWWLETHPFPLLIQIFYEIEMNDDDDDDYDYASPKLNVKNYKVSLMYNYIPRTLNYLFSISEE